VRRECILNTVTSARDSREAAIPSELALIRAIRHAAPTRTSSLSLGIGDDCAVLRPRPGYDLCVTTDFSLEGVHFRRDWHSPQSAGHRCLARGLSDLAAMGAEPLAVFLSLALPARLPAAWLDGFLAGFLALARRYRVPLAGGDTAQSPNGILADIVAVGQLPRNTARLRSTARPGDLLYVTGALGGSAAELLALSTMPASSRASVLKGHGFEPALSGAPQARSRTGAANAATKTGALAPQEIHPHLYPEPHLPIGLRLRPLVHAMIDISDGLSTDLMHLCEESGVAAEIDEAALPIHPLAMNLAVERSPALKGHGLSRAAGARKGRRALAPEGFGDCAPLHLALHGGEDYELLFTASPSAKIPRSILGVPIHCIGVIRKATRNQPRILLKTHEDRRIPLQPAGWQHFRETRKNG
jgi:thiamine-monophosphate kinase